MKLLVELQKQVGAMSSLRRAWFTSFNTDIEFVETYVIPTILGANTPRNRLEYEQLQQEMTARQIDCRVFCDPRFLETHRIKRTCIPVHGIRPQRARGQFSEKSLFHPKVIYLEDDKGKRVIGAGSANLTVSGWGRNLEAFQFFEVKSRRNYREVRSFFEKICEAVDIECALDNRRNFPVDEEPWRFVHSYQETTFPEQLLSGAIDIDVAVWSPYLPRDLRSLLDKLERATSAQKLRIHLVADRSAGYVRTPWSEQLSLLQHDGRLTFRQNPTPMDHRTELCHAKIWKVPGKLALGSWNFTGPGSNSLRDVKGDWHPDNNVEAGFIIDDRHGWLQACGEVLRLGPEHCATDEQLKTDELKVPSLPPFDLHVRFDWRAQTYQFEGKWLETGRPDTDYAVRLPGVTEPVPLVWNGHLVPASPGALVMDDSALLRDRVFRVFEVVRHDQEVFRGMVSELHVDSRRAQHFDSLADLFDAWVHGDDVEELDILRSRVPLDNDAFADDAHEEQALDHREAATGNASGLPISYFRLFQSVHAFRQKLLGLKTLEGLDQHVFSLPGCLLELVGKVRHELASPGREVFHWFLVHEVQWLCECARGRRRKLAYGYRQNEPGYSPVPESRWQVLTLPAAPTPAVSAQYLDHVRKQWEQHA